MQFVAFQPYRERLFFAEVIRHASPAYSGAGRAGSEVVRCDVDDTGGSVRLAFTMLRRVRPLLLTFAVIVTLTALGLIVLTTGRTPQRSPLPNPNGYDDFL